MLGGDKVDYRTSGNQTVNLAVPPDLTQLAGQSRYSPQDQAGSVSASEMSNNTSSVSTNTPTLVAAPQTDKVSLERDGQTRWLSTELPAEQAWEQAKAFWLEAGFELPVADPAAGVLETSWSENRAKLPQTGLRKVIGAVLDALYDTGERDQYRTRIERTAKGTEIYISHRGMQEVFTDERKQETKWVSRPSDTGLEAEMLSRLMAKLGASKEVVEAVKADGGSSAASAEDARAHLQADNVTVHVTANVEATWRRVGLSLDRRGYTIESRDRQLGVYEIRTASVQDADAPKPGLLSRLFSFGEKKAEDLARYQVKVSPSGEQSTVQVLKSQGQVDTSSGAKRIAKQLLDDLK